MGMYDDIIVPKSYLRGLLNKKHEKLFDANHTFQTKDLESLLDVYKIYRQVNNAYTVLMIYLSFYSLKWQLISKYPLKIIIRCVLI